MNLIKNSKLLIVLLCGLLVADLHATEISVLELEGVTAKVETVCIKGYLYAVVVSSRGDVSITQMFINGALVNSPVKAIKCKSN